MPESTSTQRATISKGKTQKAYTRFVLLVAGLGGLLYGVDVGIIGGALPYLEATARLSAGQLSVIVAAVLMGSVISTLFAGLLADWIGRKPLMLVSGLAFVVSIPAIALSSGYGPLFLGRLLQGISGGLIGVVVPLYLAECLPASHRGKGTGIFQWLLTLGIFAAALIGIYYSSRVQNMTATASATAVLAFKDQAWRRIFWVSLPPGVLFVLGGFFVTESPRWLVKKDKKQKAMTALLRSRSHEQASLELVETQRSARATTASDVSAMRDSLLRRKYVLPFLLACVILFCNTATGVNSIIGYNTSILLQSGLTDLEAHWGYVIFTLVNFVMTMIGVSLVDRKGRKFLLTLGCTGIVLSLSTVGILFRTTERSTVDCRETVQGMIQPDETLSITFTPEEAKRLLASQQAETKALDSDRVSLAIIYSYGDFTSATSFRRSDETGSAPLTITRESIPSNRVEAFFRNPFGNLATAQRARLKIDRAFIGAIPAASHGRLVALGLYVFMSFFAIGPGVCVWLALSELMPTRIRSNGMSIALVINQLVSTTLAGIFLPFVSRYGYSMIFFLFAGFSLIYLLTAVFFLPETKGKTLEEIEEYFEGREVRAVAH